MIWKVETLLAMDEFKDMNKDVLEVQLEAIETAIRSYTNNNFQNRNIRMTCSSHNQKLNGVSPFLVIGDTIEISGSVNEGLYVITEIGEDFMVLDKPLYDCAENLVTKVQYPADIKKGVLDMLSWEKNNRQKVGIQSETIGRHSVTYLNQETAGNSDLGYPMSILGFLRPYKKVRF